MANDNASEFLNKSLEKNKLVQTQDYENAAVIRDKVIELRKKQGLSQEELGYKLNVTRQTVSKWELGSTTPEMDKLVEISKIFNVSVDFTELINEVELAST